MKVYRKIDYYQQQVDGYLIAEKNDELCNDNQQANQPTTGQVNETQFVARVIALPLLQEGLSSTQSIASQSRLGRVLLNRTHLMIQHLNHTLRQARETPTYQHYFRQDSYLQRSLIKLDGWACTSLDIVEMRLPILHQPTATIMDTFILKPRLQLTSGIDNTWSLVITRPLASLNDRINKELDGLEHWIGRKRQLATGNGDGDYQIYQGATDLNQRLLLLGGSVLHLGLDQATVTKKYWTAWAQPLLPQNIFPLARSIKSRFSTILSAGKFEVQLTTKTKSTH